MKTIKILIIIIVLIATKISFAELSKLFELSLSNNFAFNYRICEIKLDTIDSFDMNIIREKPLLGVYINDISYTTKHNNSIIQQLYIFSKCNYAGKEEFLIITKKKLKDNSVLIETNSCEINITRTLKATNSYENMIVSPEQLFSNFKKIKLNPIEDFAEVEVKTHTNNTFADTNDIYVISGEGEAWLYCLEIDVINHKYWETNSNYRGIEIYNCENIEEIAERQLSDQIKQSYINKKRYYLTARNSSTVYVRVAFNNSRKTESQAEELQKREYTIKLYKAKPILLTPGANPKSNNKNFTVHNLSSSKKNVNHTLDNWKLYMPWDTRCYPVHTEYYDWNPELNVMPENSHHNTSMGGISLEPIYCLL